jgi:transcriptional regulator GlxA family with amidase domain
MLPVAGKTSFAGFKPSRRQAPAGRRHLVAIVAFDGVVLGDLATPSEVFGRVRDSAGRPLYELRICSLEPLVVSEHVTLKVPWRLGSLKRADTVIIPGIDHLDRRVPDKLLRELRAATERRARVASICSGAFVLAQTGALDGLKATTHWLAAAELARRFPKVEVDPGVLYVDNGNVLTSAGAAAGLDLCLHLVRRDFGAEIAAETARVAVMPLERAGGQAQFIVHQQPAAVDHASIGSLLAWMEQNLHKEISLRALARRAAMSTRTLSRRFREQVGTTPVQWILGARVRRTQVLLETTRWSIEEIAQKSGFGSSTVLREHFRRIVGTSPMAYRSAFSAGKAS